jgi:Na+-transporting methylmalonyl-CoA/oxaloacetate decarboxylase gamma subunit
MARQSIARFRSVRMCESGVGVTIMGISAVLVLMVLLFATQTLVVLQRRSIVHSIASDIASQVATQRFAANDVAYTKSVVRLLGDPAATVKFQNTPDMVIVTVRATSPSLLTKVLGALTGVDQTVQRRIEKEQ